jgi:hypothetical protein
MMLLIILYVNRIKVATLHRLLNYTISMVIQVFIAFFILEFSHSIVLVAVVCEIFYFFT